MQRKLELFYALTTRDVQARYKQAAIGMGWSLLQPLTLMLIFSLVFGRLLKVETGGTPYPIFVYACLVPWTFFANGLPRAVSSIEVNAGIIKKVNFDFTLFPISSIAGSLLDFLAASLVFVAMMAYYHVALNPMMLLVIPLVVLQVVLMVGLGLLLSSLNAYLRDVKFALPLIIQLWFYITPIVYAVEAVPQRFQALYGLNPMCGLMVGYRNVLLNGTAPDWGLLGVAVAVTALIFLAGHLVFQKLEGNFADVV